MSGSCTPYQPLPISTGASGLDRCGNVVAYAAPSVVQAPVGWGCWPIQFQGWWLYQGPFGTPAPGWSGGWNPNWWWGQPHPAHPIELPPNWWWPYAGNLSQIMSGGAALANWMIAQRQQRAA